MLSRFLRLAPLAIMVVSAFTGAVLAALPAMVVALVTLFYNSTGGVLIFLGNLIGLLPRPFSGPGGTSALPVFQQLDINTSAIVLWSVTASILCLIAASAALVTEATRTGRPWLITGSCCFLASIAGGPVVTVAVIPAMTISIGHLISQRMHRGE